jgi:predicted aconitase
VELTSEEREILGGKEGRGCQAALQYQMEVGKFWGAKRFVPVSNVHMMGDIEVMGDAGLEYLKQEAGRGARCAVGTTTNARCMDFAHCERMGAGRRRGGPRKRS